MQNNRKIDIDINQLKRIIEKLKFRFLSYTYMFLWMISAEIFFRYSDQFFT